MLGFDIPTFAFQIVNFLILLAILGRFFYRPVLDVMQRRQEQIDARIEDAEQRARTADEERQKLAQQSEAASREAAALLESARNQAAHERLRQLEAAKAEAAAVIDEARKTAAAEEQAAMSRLGNRLSESAVRIAGILIRDASGEAVHEALFERLLAEGWGIDDSARDQLKLDFQNDSGQLVLQSAYPLDDSQVRLVREQAAQVLGRTPESLSVEVRETPDLIAGVRLLAGALVIDMSMKHLLNELSSSEHQQ